MGISFKEYCIGNGLPDLLAQWDAEANLPLTPETVPWSVHRKIHWLCEKGHAWTAYTYDRIKGTGLCPVCAGKRIVPGINDLQSQYPELTRQWHPTKNQGLDPATISPSSNQRVWWRCEKGHEWRAVVYLRTRINTGCPICAGKQIMPGVNDLQSQYPNLMREWHQTKNHGLDPAKISAHSHQKAWWQCEKGHEWQAQIKSRVNGSGCPICANRRILPGFNNLATTHPELVKEWNYEKNGVLKPEQVLSGSVKKVWWRCEQGHEWDAGIHSRSIGNGCPICSGKKIVAGTNDLPTLYPEVAKEWDSEKNGSLSPTQLGGSSNRRVWWKCSLGHSYRAVIASRTAGETGCPYCSGKRVLAGFNDLATVEPQIAAQWHPTMNAPLIPEQVTRGSTKRVWWICDEGHVWKAPVYSRTGKRRHGCPYCNGRYRKDPTPFVREAVSAEMWIDKQALPDADPFHITTESHTGEEATAMRTIIVDNDQAELRRFSQLSQGVRDIQIVGQFESDLEALMYVRENPVELAFLNISVSSAGGITLAKELRKIREGMLIVFASESGKWINDANKIGGDYYLIKPYSRGALEMAMDRVRLIAQRLKRTLTIQTFGEFTVLKEGKPISLAGKAKEILALLVSRRGQEISNRELYAILWPGREYSNHNMSVLYNALNRLRNSLRKEGAENLLITTAHGHMINTELFDCDYYMWEDAAPGEREEFEATFLSQYMWARNVLENKKEPYGLAVAAQGR